MAAGQVISPGQNPDDMDEEVVESSLSAIEEADRGHQVSTARKYPRSITKFRQELTEIARASQSVAMEMMYSLPRGGKQLVGPSIRFAEAVLSCWGNARAGVEVVNVDKQAGVVVSEGRFYDCEKNVGLAIRVRRRNVTTKKDDDSYQVLGLAASSLALRNAILRGVPKALWADIFETAKQTAAGQVDSMDKVRNESIALFKALGVTPPRIFAALGIAGVADIGTEEVLAMKTWHKQLISREATIEDIFGSPDDEEIETLMEELGYNPTQKRMGRQNYKGRPAEHLAYLRDQASKAASAKGSPIAPDPHAEEKKPEPTMDAVDKTAEVVAEVSKHPESKPEPQPEPEPQASHTAAPAKSQKKINW